MGILDLPQWAFIAAFAGSLPACRSAEDASDEEGPGSLGTTAATSPCDFEAPPVSDEMFLPYGPCNRACRNRDDAYCPSWGDPAASPDAICTDGAFTVCAWNCDADADCAPPPRSREVVCHLSSCLIDCSSAPCPDGMTCVMFGDGSPGMEPRPVCAYYAPP